MLQVRNVPESMHRNLKARAALAGMSLSEYVLLELRKSLERPTREEFLDRLSRRARVKLSRSAAEILREERDAR